MRQVIVELFVNLLPPLTTKLFLGVIAMEDEQESPGTSYDSKSRDEVKHSDSSRPSSLEWIEETELSEVRVLLESGYFKNYIPRKFWWSLQNTLGSALSYIVGFLLILYINQEWMFEEFVDEAEGHLVAKTFVILFIFYSFSFITLGFELILFAFLLLRKCCPNRCEKLELDFSNFLSKLNRCLSNNNIVRVCAVFWTLISTFTGSCLWQWFWWNHICKSYHDRTCRGSWLGEYVRSHRNGLCHDEKTTDLMCERLFSYSPIIIFAVIVVLVGNVIMPLINNWMSSSSWIHDRLRAALQVLDDGSLLAELATSSSTTELSSTGNSEQESVAGEIEKMPSNSNPSGFTRYVPALSGVVIMFLCDYLIINLIS